MSTSWASCPQGFMWPHYVGVKQSSEGFTFAPSIEVQLRSLDFNEEYMVASGYYNLFGATSFWP